MIDYFILMLISFVVFSPSIYFFSSWLTEKIYENKSSKITSTSSKKT